ncbi:DUF3889 domain-containing protein [Brevibacillus laterosporus]|uniref:DUF3889 domain-containing protein n=1 Tax=Brevibacillus laterosporus TaxID=1465 RepID=UPI000680D0BB|nr:DUF3889 domain-containing protein [Brevibacillus laterosporus]
MYVPIQSLFVISSLCFANTNTTTPIIPSCNIFENRHIQSTYNILSTELYLLRDCRKQSFCILHMNLKNSNEIPSYAKWGKLAVRKTMQKYSNADIIDYLYIGRRKLSSTTSQEEFKLWLRQGKIEWGVLVFITLNTQTEEVISINFKSLK